MSKKATDIFTPGSFPTYTYVERKGEALEQSLKDALDTPGQPVSLVGPSKSGKTVLVEKVVGRDNLITITGAGIESPEDIWNRVLNWMDVPETQTKTSSTEIGIEGGVAGKLSGGIPLIAKSEAQVTGNLSATHNREGSASYGRGGLQRVIREIAGSDFVLLVDDFHYMPRDVQIEAAKSLKEATRLGVKICVASVTHRGDDVVRANPELRGRVRSIDLKYWSTDELEQIADIGFNALNVNIEQSATRALAKEAAGSPQLMQSLCLNSCFICDIRNAPLLQKNQTFTALQLRKIYEQTAANTDFRSLVDVLDAGPRTRGAERKLYQFDDGSMGDVYRCVLKAIATDPPQLSFSYDELLGRVSRVCNNDVPVGSSVNSTVVHMSRLAIEKFPNEQAVDWDEQTSVLDLPDPYLLFYLRWSDRLHQI